MNCMKKRILSTEEELLWLAEEMDDCTGGNSNILLDWGNYEIKCTDGSAPCPELKSRLVDLVRDWKRMKNNEIENQKIALAHQV